MKANAPEKIYIPRLEGNTTFVHEWSATKFRKYFNREIAENVEYIHADAFIEKTCDWLSDNLQTIVDVDCPSEHHVESIPVLGSITQTEFLNKFRKEIKYLFDR